MSYAMPVPFRMAQAVDFLGCRQRAQWRSFIPGEVIEPFVDGVAHSDAVIVRPSPHWWG